MGVGIRAEITKNLNAGLEIVYRKTFTDNLDDVSGRFVSKDLLITENGMTAWELSNRTDEVNDGSGNSKR